MLQLSKLDVSKTVPVRLQVNNGIFYMHLSDKEGCHSQCCGAGAGSRTGMILPEVWAVTKRQILYLRLRLNSKNNQFVPAMDLTCTFSAER